MKIYINKIIIIKWEITMIKENPLTKDDEYYVINFLLDYSV